MAKKKGTQGATSSIEDLVLTSDDTPVVEKLGVAILPTAKLERTIYGADTIEFEVFDPKRRVLKSQLLSTKWDAEVDGLAFRFPGVLQKSGPNLSITLEDKWVKVLKEAKGPKQARRSKVTRAEFILSLLEEAAPGLEFVCPRLHEKQPVKKLSSKAKARKAKEEAESTPGGKGFKDNAKGLTCKGQKASARQIEVIDESLRVAESCGSPQAVQIAVVCTLIAESDAGETGLQNVMGANQEVEPGVGAKVGSLAEEVAGFCTNEPEWTGEGANEYYEAHPGASPAEIAQAIQNAGIPTFSQWEAEARKWVEAFEGGEASGDLTLTKAYKFTVEKTESYWAAIKRLAAQVNWRFFILGNRAFYMPEPEIAQGMVWAEINDEVLEDEHSGVENVDFEYDGNNPVTEIEITAQIAQFGCDPGRVIVLADHGPASVGFPEAPAKHAISQINVPAKTGEGAARYIVTEIEVPLVDDLAQRTATIKAHKPTAPLPEPRAETSSVGGIKGSAEGLIPADAPPAVANMINRAVELEGTPYKWGGGHDGFHSDPDSLDCSGAVSDDLHAGDLLDSPLSSVPLESFGEAGKGEWVTIYANADHAWMELRTSEGWKCWGTSVGDSGAGGLGWHDDPGDAYRAEFTVRHPKGL